MLIIIMLGSKYDSIVSKGSIYEYITLKTYRTDMSSTQ